jgi:hypothetical protein
LIVGIHELRNKNRPVIERGSESSKKIRYSRVAAWSIAKRNFSVIALSIAKIFSSVPVSLTVERLPVSGSRQAADVAMLKVPVSL